MSAHIQQCLRWRVLDGETCSPQQCGHAIRNPSSLVYRTSVTQRRYNHYSIVDSTLQSESQWKNDREKWHSLIKILWSRSVPHHRRHPQESDVLLSLTPLTFQPHGWDRKINSYRRSRRHTAWKFWYAGWHTVGLFKIYHCESVQVKVIFHTNIAKKHYQPVIFFF